MPKITIKTVYIEKLKQLGVYDKWLANVKDGHDRWDGQNKIEKDKSFNYFIQWSFEWSRALESSEYWRKIANS